MHGAVSSALPEMSFDRGRRTHVHRRKLAKQARMPYGEIDNAINWRIGVDGVE